LKSDGEQQRVERPNSDIPRFCGRSPSAWRRAWRLRPLPDRSRRRFGQHRLQLFRRSDHQPLIAGCDDLIVAGIRLFLAVAADADDNRAGAMRNAQRPQRLPDHGRALRDDDRVEAGIFKRRRFFLTLAASDQLRSRGGDLTTIAVAKPFLAPVSGLKENSCDRSP
jgi:hypothetical protein